MSMKFNESAYAVLATICMAFALVGCTTTQKTTAGGFAIGGAIGGGIGWLLGKATGKDPETAAAIGAGAGAVIIGIAGHEYGKKATKKREGYASTSDFLDSEIAETRSARETMMSENERLASQCAVMEREAASLESQYQSSQDRKAALASLRTKTSNELETAQKQLEKTEEIIRYQRKGVMEDPEVKAGNSRTTQLEQEVKALEETKEYLANTVQRLKDLNDRLALL